MATTGNLLGTATSGLLAYQRALATTGHNVSNLGTPGYSRQKIELETRIPLTSTAGFIGNGVNINSISRAYDEFISTQLRSTTATSSELSTYYRLAGQIDNIVANPDAGLTIGMQEFFNAVQTLASDPESTAARQVLMSQSASLVNRFHYLDDRLANLKAVANNEVRSAATQITAFGQGIAQLNQQIYEALGDSSGQPPNDLLDQRDEAVRSLSELVSAKVVNTENGMVNVFIGNGQSLVLGNRSAELSLMQNEFDPDNLDIGFSFNNGSVVNISAQLTGGSLGGALEFRDGLLKTTTDQLGRVALGLTEVFNAQHRLGMTQDDALGGDYFEDMGTIQAVSNRYNNAATDLVFTGDVTDIGAIEPSDYKISYLAGTYTMTRMSDNTIVGVSGAPAFNLTATEGFTVSSVGAVVSDGDSFILRFTDSAAQNIGMQITQYTQIAAASPLRTESALTNVGNGTISNGAVSNTTAIPLAAPITLTYSPNALGVGIPGFTVVGGPGGTLAYDPATESGGKTFTFAGFGGFTFDIAGVPTNGDQFTIENNTGGIGDNTNALALAALQNDFTLVNGATGPTASLMGAYTQLVSDVGARTHQAAIDSQVQATQLLQSQESWSNVAGVNLDEEAANLLKFQQAYQAAAQVISAASLIFDTLLGAVRR